MPLSNNPPNNFELWCEQDHEYFLNRFPFATWKSCGLSPFVRIRELFFLLSPGSSRQSSCEFLQPRLTCPSTIHGELAWTKAFHEWMQFCHGCWEYACLDPLTFVVNKTSVWHSILRGLLSKFFYKCCHAFLWRPIFIVSVRSIRKSNYSQRSYEWPELKFHWRWSSCLAKLLKAFTSPIVGKCALEAHLENW